MSRKRKKQQNPFFYLALPIFLAVFFAFRRESLAGVEANLIINEIQISGGKSKTNEDYIELYNKSAKSLSIGNWKLRKKNQSGTESSVKVLSATAVVPAHGYFLWSNTSIASKIQADESTSAYLSANNSVALLDDKDNIVDEVAWGTGHSNPFVEKASFDVAGFIADAPEVIRRKNFQDTGNNAEDFEISLNGNPQASGCLENPLKCEIIQEVVKYPNQIFLNEIYPKPNKGIDQKEFVEIFNATGEKIVLDGWKIVDYGKNECLLNGKSVEVGKFIVLEDNSAENCNLAMNDTGVETVWLKNPNGETVSVVSYTGAKEGSSYNFDGSAWHWSKFLTPGSKNLFNSQPYGTTEIDEYIYVNVYANFVVSTGDLDGENVKVVWDFGDGHKSYLSKTEHKYTEVGIYQVSLKLSDSVEDIVKNFEVKVEELSHPKVKIVAVNANPAGADNGIESLTIENKSDKKLNLNGWSILTGWKKLIRHVIHEDVWLKKGKNAEVTNAVASFSLNNTKAEIQLRYPDDKLASKVRYKKNGGIAEDEIYQKIKGGWEWIEPQQKQEIVKVALENQRVAKGDVLEVIADDSDSATNKWELEPKKARIRLANLNVYAKRPEAFQEENFVFERDELYQIRGQYFFTKNLESPHYALTFLENMQVKLNGWFSQLLNYFSSN